MANSKAPHLDAFLDAARYFIGIKEINGSNTFASGSKGAEMASLAGFGQGFAWCAAFISACAQKAGIANVLISKQTAAGWLQEATVLYYGGTWIDGPYNNGGVAVTPMPGDIISFANSSYYGRGHATHVGIVEYVEDGKVHTIEGNTSDECARRSYDLDCSRINEYVRPDWSRVGDDVSSYLSAIGEGGVIIGPLYQNRNDRHDMTLRQVGYLDRDYNLSNISSNIAISVINYTSVLGDLYDRFAPTAALMAGTQVDTSQLEGNVKVAMDFLLKMGFSASGASGIVGCLQIYSGVNPAYSKMNTKDFRYRYGICAWSYTKLSAIKERVGDAWQTNLSGQLEFLLDDLSSYYSGMVSILKYSDLGETQTETCAQLFMASYNKDFDIYGYKENAKKEAVDIYTKLVITQSAIIGNTANLRDINGTTLSAQYSVSIPGTVPQTGIIDDYTSYSAWYSKWHGSSPQKKLAVLWGDQGFPCDKGVATIGGYYCVAVRPKFGKCGEVIVVTLDDGVSFPCIICDEKGEDAGSEWGHVKGSGNISLIEWERVKTSGGKVVTGTGYSDVDSRGFSDWYGKKVSMITNYGKYTDVRWS